VSIFVVKAFLTRNFVPSKIGEKFAFLEEMGSKCKIKIKSGTNDYVGEGNPHAKFNNNQITGGLSLAFLSSTVPAIYRGSQNSKRAV